MIGLSNTLSRIRKFLEQYTLHKSNNIPVSFKDLGYIPGLLKVKDENRLITEKDKEIILNRLKRTVPEYYKRLKVTLRELETKYSKPWLEYKKCLDKTVKIKSLKKEWRRMEEWRNKKWGKKGMAEVRKLFPHLSTRTLRSFVSRDAQFSYWELYWVDWVIEKHPDLCREFDIRKIKSYLEYKLNEFN